MEEDGYREHMKAADTWQEAVIETKHKTELSDTQHTRTCDTIHEKETCTS